MYRRKKGYLGYSTFPGTLVQSKLYYLFSKFVLEISVKQLCTPKQTIDVSWQIFKYFYQ